MGGLAKAISRRIDEVRENRAKKFYRQILVDDYDRLPKSIRKLASVKHPVTLLAFVSLLKHSYPEVRTEALEQIGYKRKYLNENKELKEKVCARITDLVFSEQHHLREAGVSALGKLDDPAFAVRRIKRLLEVEKVDSVIIRMIDVLAKYKDRSESAKTCLNGMLSNPNYVRYYKEVSAALVRNNY